MGKPEETSGLGILSAAFADFRAEHSSDVIVYSGPISYQGFRDLSRIIIEKGTASKRVHVFLSTLGGDAHAAFKLSRYLSLRYDHVSLYINGMCKSAGTLITLGATDLVMSDLAELGPLDAQIQKPNELVERGSGLDLMQALDALSEKALATFRQSMLECHKSGIRSSKMATKLARQLTASLFTPIYSQIDPVRVGEVERAVAIAYEYGKRLSGKNLNNGALMRLVAQYPSHGFVIDRKEAKELFKNVRAPTDSESRLSTHFAVVTEDPMQTPAVLFFPVSFDIAAEVANATGKKAPESSRPAAAAAAATGAPGPVGRPAAPGVPAPDAAGPSGGDAPAVEAAPRKSRGKSSKAAAA